MEEVTQHNLYTAFVGEAKAHFRLQAFAEKAEEEGYAQIARLFRAIAEAERVHAVKHLRLLREVMVKSTEENLEASFERETTINTVTYPGFIRQAEEEGQRETALGFSQSRDAEEGHAQLYKKAMVRMLQDEVSDYYVCQVCGYTSDGVLPDECPICGVSKERFKRIE